MTSFAVQLAATRRLTTGRRTKGVGVRRYGRVFGTVRGTCSAPLATGRLTDGSRRSVGQTLADGVGWRAAELRRRETCLSEDPSPLRNPGLAEEHHAKRVIA